MICIDVVWVGLYVAFLSCRFAPSLLTQCGPFSIPDVGPILSAPRCLLDQTSIQMLG
jgi:hypothetical protein